MTTCRPRVVDPSRVASYPGARRRNEVAIDVCQSVGRWRFLPAQRGSTFTARKDWNEGKKRGRKMARACFAAARNAHARSLVRISPPSLGETCPRFVYSTPYGYIPFRYRDVSILLNVPCCYIFVETIALILRPACLLWTDRLRNRGRSRVFSSSFYLLYFCLEINLINSNHIKEILLFFFFGWFCNASFTFLSSVLRFRRSKNRTINLDVQTIPINLANILVFFWH